jgi:diguanylate cyclase
MSPVSTPQLSAVDLKRLVLMAILAVSLFGTAAGWVVIEHAGNSSGVLRTVFALNMAFHPTMFVILWRRVRPTRFVELGCLLFASITCAICMALGLYSPTYGESIDLQPLYLWIPIIYVFVFILADHRRSLMLALALLTTFVLISLPYVVWGADAAHRNFTIQLHCVSAVLIAALYFFASHQHRLQLAQLTADELTRLASTDELTGLANRRRVTETLEAELRRFDRYGHEFSIVLIDVDHFKAVNDRLGHGAGDRALIGLAGRGLQLLRSVDTLGRWGGEEFVAVLPETSFDETVRKAASLCEQVAATPLINGCTITVSCGVTTVSAGDSVESLLQRADEALYAAKRGGRNRAEGVLNAQLSML